MAQAEACPTPIRNLAHARRVLAHQEALAAKPRRFVVECRSPTGERYIAEIDCQHTSLAAIVCEMVSGQFSNVIRAYELTDASEEVASAVARHCEDYGLYLTRDAADFIENNGVSPIDDLVA